MPREGSGTSEPGGGRLGARVFHNTKCMPTTKELLLVGVVRAHSAGDCRLSCREDCGHRSGTTPRFFPRPWGYPRISETPPRNPREFREFLESAERINDYLGFFHVERKLRPNKQVRRNSWQYPSSGFGSPPAVVPYFVSGRERERTKAQYLGKVRDERRQTGPTDSASAAVHAKVILRKVAMRMT
ncbi:hypothetical protein BC827DRAFT_496202 [Russula dissimulans]|nr:hypothetical protein BC827DRAFT_496202 [Russula dissimulans]